MISGALIDPYGSHDEFGSVNNALKEHDDMKEKIKIYDFRSLSKMLI